LFYLMKMFYLLTTIVVLLAGDEAADRATLDTRHLPDQGAAPSRKGCMAGQRYGGLGRDVRVMIIIGVQSHLRAEMAEPIEQEVGAPLRGGRSRPQDLEASMIQSFSFFISFSY
jgi:hypothetical protein